ncbi:Fc receptor-like protein 5 [Liasis olivaceus]
MTGRLVGWDPQNPVYIHGEQVKLICSAPEGLEVAGYTLYSRESEDVMNAKEINGTSGKIGQYQLIAEERTAGEYRCHYQRVVSGRKMLSPWSSPASVAVTDPPPAPTLVLDPHQPLYIHGEPVRLICSAPEGLEGAGYTFYFRESEDVMNAKEINGTNGKIGQYQLIAEERTAGEYRCQSSTVVSGREIFSPWSSPASVAVTDPLPAPTLVLDPQQPVYVHGEPVRLICSAPEGLEGAGYTFYSGRLQDVKNVKEINRTRGKIGQYQLIVEERTAGEYSCLSWTVKSGREILSPGSNSVSVAVTDPLPAPTLVLDPQQPVYIHRERVRLICSAPEGLEVAGYTFYSGRLQDVRDVKEINGTHGKIGQYQLIVEERTAGEYRYPQQPVYIHGELVRLICSAPEGLEVAGYTFYFRESEDVMNAKEINGTSAKVGQYQLIAEERTAGEYRCQSSTVASGREIFSPWSSPASVSVIDPQQPVYVHGEPVRLICSAPEGLEGAGYTFYSGRLQDVKNIKEINRTRGKIGQYQLIVEERTAGEYSCLSWTVKSGREILSPGSNSVSVAVTGKQEVEKKRLLSEGI